MTAQDTSELLRLRGEVARLRDVDAQLTALQLEYTSLQQALVRVVPVSELFVFVGGAGIKIPSRQPFTQGVTVGQAITGAGGFNDEADQSKVELIRAGVAP